MMPAAMDQRPRQALDYANLHFHGETAGRPAPHFASAGLLLVAISFAITYLTARSWHPILYAIEGYCLLAVPLACLAAIISSARGLIYASRYRTRSIAGLVLAALALLGGMLLLGRSAIGFK